MLKYLSILILTIVLLSNCASEKRITLRNETKKEKASNKLQDFEISVTNDDALLEYYKHEKIYIQPGNIKDVWEVYCHTDPKILWHGPKSKFKMAYSLATGTGFYKREPIIPCLSKGMIYNLRLKIFAFYKIPVTFEITELSYDQKIIEFTYGLNNRSHGKQILHFERTNDGTKIIHTSYYLSGNKIRDKRLYPFFHEKYLDEFHENAKKRLTNFVSAY